MNIRNIDDPARLREVIDKWSRVNDPLFRDQAIKEAEEYAGENAWLLSADEWSRRTAIMIATGLTLQGLFRIPDPGRALVIQPLGMSTWRYVTDAPTREAGGHGHCDRCVPSLLETERPSIWDTRIEALVHVPVDMFVIEFAFCRNCMVYLASLATNVTERSRIDAGDTYVEFERSTRTDRDDTEV